MIKYSNQQYSESAQLLEQDDIITDTTMLYLLISKVAITEEIKLQDFEVQLRQFTNSSSLAQQLRWYAGLYYIKLGDRSKSVAFFSMIQNGDFKYLEAQEIIGSLER